MLERLVGSGILSGQAGARRTGRDQTPLQRDGEYRASGANKKVRHSQSLLTGVATDTCVESAGRDAYFIDYYITMVEDCCGAASEEDHPMPLKRFNRDYGQVVTSGEVIDAWRSNEVRCSSPVPIEGAI